MLEDEYDNVVEDSSVIDEVNNEVLPDDDNDGFVIKSSLVDNDGVLLVGVWYVVSKLPLVVSDAEVPTNSSIFVTDYVSNYVFVIEKYNIG